MAYLDRALHLVAVISMLIAFGWCNAPTTPPLPESIALNSRELELSYSGCPTYVNSSRLSCTINRRTSSKEDVLAFGLYAVVSQSFQITIPEIDNGRLAYCGKYPRTRKLFDPVDFRVSVNSCVALTINRERTLTHRKFIADLKLHREGRRLQLTGPSRNYVLCSAMMSNGATIVHLVSQFIPLPLCPVAYEGDETTAHEPAEVPITRRPVVATGRKQVTIGETTPEPIEDSGDNSRSEGTNEEILYNVAVIVGLTLLGLVSASGAYLYWHFSCNVMDPSATSSTKRLTTTAATESTLRESARQSHMESVIEGSKKPPEGIQSEHSAVDAELLRSTTYGDEMQSTYAKSTVPEHI